MPDTIDIWNSVVLDGMAFPQTEPLTLATGKSFFADQSYTGVATDSQTDEVIGLYILHPNTVGRCGHICNASYAVKKDKHGHHSGEHLVKHCISTAKQLNFKILQFNVVVKNNRLALALYKKLGFIQLGVIPNGFLTKNGSYEVTIPPYITL